MRNLYYKKMFKKYVSAADIDCIAAPEQYVVLQADQDFDFQAAPDSVEHPQPRRRARRAAAGRPDELEPVENDAEAAAEPLTDDDTEIAPEHDSDDSDVHVWKSDPSNSSDGDFASGSANENFSDDDTIALKDVPALSGDINEVRAHVDADANMDCFY